MNDYLGTFLLPCVMRLRACVYVCLSVFLFKNKKEKKMKDVELVGNNAKLGVFLLRGGAFSWPCHNRRSRFIMRFIGYVPLHPFCICYITFSVFIYKFQNFDLLFKFPGS